MDTILLIEDDKVLRENTAEILELSNYKVVMAANGKVGLEMAREILPNIIVCDIMMPELDGYGVLKELSRDESTSNIPFIFLSAKTERKEIRMGMDMGADDYLTKPFEEDELISAIESRLAKTILLEQKTQIGESGQPNSNELKSLNELKKKIDDNGEIFSYGKGEVIYGEGSRPSKIFLILNGAVKCYKMDEDGKQLITSLHSADDFLGFANFFNNSPYRETAIAIEKVELVGISQEILMDILRGNHDFTMELMQLLTDNLSETKEQLLQMAYSSVRKKTALTLIQFSEILKKKPREDIKISRSDLASVAGVAQESLIRTLSSFKNEGYLDIIGRNIRIINQNALQRII